MVGRSGAVTPARMSGSLRLVLACALVLVLACSATGCGGGGVVFPDANLDAAIRANISDLEGSSKAQGTIYASDLAK
ncbi:MAG: hypothetical protein NTU41_03335, partial [Chloroflexi bacterium]|nr:hypothetical protein [Chloroflexota bacterium]